MDPRPALCRLHAVDDGVSLAATGVLWAVGATDWTIILCASLGWQKKKHSRSHKVVAKGPTFVYMRRAELAGTPVQFCHMKKIHVQTLFREGHVHASVNQSMVAREIALCHSFLQENDDEIQHWMNIDVVAGKAKEKKSNKMAKEEKAATLVIKTRPLKRSLRVRQREEKQLADLRAKEAEIKLQSHRNSQRLQMQQRRREMEQDMKKAAAEEVENSLSEFKEKMEKQLSAVQKKCSRVVSDTFQKTVTKSVDKALNPTVRFMKKQEKAMEKYQSEQQQYNLQQEQVLDDLSGRFDDLIQEFEHMSAVVAEVNKWKRTVSKKMERLEKGIQSLRAASKQLKTRLDKHEAEAKAKAKREQQCPPKKKKKNKRRKVAATTNVVENVAPAAVQVQQHVEPRQPQPMLSSVGPPASAVSPPWWGTRPANGVGAVRHPPYNGTPRPEPVSGAQPHFVSPIYASRNILR